MPNFRPTDRLTDFLVPPSVGEGLPEKHLVRFVAEIVDGLDLSAMNKSYRGSASYHPAVLLSRLVQPSSRTALGCMSSGCATCAGFSSPG
jgi:hypothetical protein